MKLEPYSFHCTPCGKAHAGECPPKKPKAEFANGAFPSIGTWWEIQDKNSDGTWTTRTLSQGVRILYRVINFDSADSQRVEIETHDDRGGTPFNQFANRQAFEETGDPPDEKWACRFIRSTAPKKP